MQILIHEIPPDIHQKIIDAILLARLCGGGRELASKMLDAAGVKVPVQVVGYLARRMVEPAAVPDAAMSRIYREPKEPRKRRRAVNRDLKSLPDLIPGLREKSLESTF